MAKSQGTTPTPVSRPKILLFRALVLLIYVPALLWMWDRWFARDSYYSHGILIPIVSAYLLWQKRDAIKKTPVEPSGWGLPLFFLGIAIHLAGALFRVYFTSGFSFILVVCGLLLHFCGVRLLRQVLFPVLFLIFMVPLPEVIITGIAEGTTPNTIYFTDHSRGALIRLDLKTCLSDLVR